MWMFADIVAVAGAGAFLCLCAAYVHLAERMVSDR